jgi:hypothetical protein
MANWSDLERELDLWHDAGQVATFWWRDDDAVDATKALEPLLELSRRHAVPVHLAIVPAGVTPALVHRLKNHPHVCAMQHGLAHINHEPPGCGASEFGASRDPGLLIGDLRKGRELLVASRTPNLLPVFVPPWNRVANGALARLPALGFRAISAFAGPTTRAEIPGLLQLHALVDPIRWKKGNSFRGAGTMLEMIVAQLKDRRQGRSDPGEPTGLLTHHLQTRPQVWAFVDELMTCLAQHDSARWISLASLIPPLRAAA